MSKLKATTTKKAAVKAPTTKRIGPIKRRIVSATDKGFMKCQSVGDFFKWYREACELTQRELANDLECSHVYLSQLENNEYEMPYMICRKLAETLTDDQRAFLRALLVPGLGLGG